MIVELVLGTVHQVGGKLFVDLRPQFAVRFDKYLGVMLCAPGLEPLPLRLVLAHLDELMLRNRDADVDQSLANGKS